MGTIGRKPNDAPLTSADINDGIVTPDDLSVGHPTWTTDGKVGIGTSAPVNIVHVKNSNPNIRLESTNGSSSIYAQVYTDASGSLHLLADTGNAAASTSMRFLVDANEAMRIASSGTVLVGKTASNSDNEGCELLPDGIAAFTCDGFQPLNLNRKTTDGTLIDLRREGTTKAKIGVTSDSLTLDVGVAERMRIDSSGHAIIPAGVTLGTAAGVYNAANTLDDYEEGTWTPTYTAATNFTSVTYDPQVGARYTKIGNMVYVTGTLYTDAISGGSGAVYIGGLPFTVAPASNGTDDRGSLTINQIEAFAGDFPHIAQCIGGSDIAGLKYKTIANGQNYSLQATDMGTGANANLLRFSGFYTTNQ